jgi:hypothetical protein
MIFDRHCLFLLISELLAGNFGLNTDIISNKSNKSYGSGWCIDFFWKECVYELSILKIDWIYSAAL